ncbi:MAG TPA: CHAP domain-containing protein [Candidatus Dormibacteraeota bacterium]|nr:CHAP domain-containing protein [Candidatus Dormibacteraeota bacterium]
MNIDQVSLWVTTPILPSAAFTVSVPSDASQVAVSSTTTPFNELTIMTIPYGKGSSVEEELPVAQAGIGATYVSALQTLRQQEGGTALPAPVATIFGQQVQAISNLVPLNIDPYTPVPVAVTEWVAEMGQRVWILRLSQATVNNSLFTPPALATGIQVAANGPMNPDNPGKNQGGSNGSTDSQPGSTPQPQWWNGQVCDASFYSGQAHQNPKQLAVWNGLTACGPRPYGDGAPDIQRYFTDSSGTQVGMWQYEWECVELSKRWLWLAYGVAPRSANGSQMVSAYRDAPGLTAVADGSGVPPVPGDVLSWGPTSGNGHTAVVTDSHVDPSGNGYIMIIEQNFSTSGTARVAVNRFSVDPHGGSSNGWLHAGTPPASAGSPSSPGGTASGNYQRPCQYGSSSTIYRGGPYPPGYWLVGADGGVFTVTNNSQLGFYGSMGGQHLNAAMVGMARTTSAQGYWLVGADGGIFSFGDAQQHFYGSLGGQTLNKCVVGMVATNDGNGYWLVAADGGVFAFGDAGFYGSAGSMQLNANIVGMAATPDGRGYWLVGADGGVFTFGDAVFSGAATNLGSPRPFVSITPTPSGTGYWLVNTNGQVYSFGGAQYLGGTGTDCNCIGSAVATPDGGGYYMLGYNGIPWTFGNAYNRGGWSAGPPFVGIALSS